MTSDDFSVFVSLSDSSEEKNLNVEEHNVPSLLFLFIKKKKFFSLICFLPSSESMEKLIQSFEHH